MEQDTAEGDALPNPIPVFRHGLEQLEDRYGALKEDRPKVSVRLLR